MKRRSGIPESKECNKCHETKPALAFSPSRSGLRAMCKACQNARKKKRVPVPKVDPAVDEGAINSAFRKWFGWVARTTLKQTV